MTPYEQNQKNIESLIKFTVLIRLNSGQELIGLLKTTIISRSDEISPGYFHAVLVVQDSTGEKYNINWSDVSLIKNQD